MAEERVQRRLAAILAADVVGYSRLMEADEEGTRTRLTSLLKKIIEPQIAADGGRIVKTIGDGILVEYSSAVDAVRSALALQLAVADHNTHLASGQPLVFRMGINVGDVIIEGDDIHGDGVNVAARLEGICVPGEVYISGTVQGHVEGKLTALFEDLGEQSVKNISRPIRVYRVLPAAAKTPFAGNRASPSPSPGKPAIAVLPFENMADDVERDYFANGITEDIITELSRLPELLVISRNSTFTYKGRTTKVQEVCKDLGAGYVVEGRVRKAGDRVRINAQLIDGRTGGYLWAERYDRVLEDIFAVQDDVAEKIVQALEINLVQGAVRQEAGKRFHDTEAYDCVLRGREQYRLFTRESNAAARNLYQRAIDLDPNYAEPYAGLAETYLQDWFLGAEPTLDRAFDYAQMAAERDATLPLVHEALSTVHLFMGRHDEAVEIARRWTEFEPSSADAYAALAGAKHFSGENEEVIALIEKAMRLNPLYPFFYPHYMGLAHMGLHRYEHAVVALKRGANRNPEALWPHVFLAACLGHLTKADEAATEIAEIRRISPDFSILSARKLLPYRKSEDFDRLVDGLQMAGLSKLAADAASLALPDKPSIAVLPFTNMSGDPEQEYFADGMVEDIITGLARIRWLTVIARNSTFAYKGNSPDVRKVGRDLAVRYVVEGSVRKAGNNVRLSAQLIEAEAGGHLWADKFSGSLDDVFELQDQITAGVVAAIEPSIREAEIERAKRKRPDNLDAYDLYLRALEQSYTYTPAGRDAGLSLLDAAIALDPNYAQAHGVAAFCLQQRFLWGGRSPADREAALAHAKAVAVARTDDATTLAFAALALSALASDHDAALVMVDRALELNPSSAISHNVYALINMMLGLPEKSVFHAERSLRLSPFDPLRHIPECALSVAKLAEGQPEAALVHVRRGLDATPVFSPGLITLALCLVRLGRIEDARSTVSRLVEIAPDTRIVTLHERYLFSNGLGIDRIMEDMRVAGLPE